MTVLVLMQYIIVIIDHLNMCNNSLCMTFSYFSLLTCVYNEEYINIINVLTRIDIRKYTVYKSINPENVSIIFRNIRYIRSM